MIFWGEISVKSLLTASALFVQGITIKTPDQYVKTKVALKISNANKVAIQPGSKSNNQVPF